MPHQKIHNEDANKNVKEKKDLNGAPDFKSIHKFFETLYQTEKVSLKVNIKNLQNPKGKV